MATERKLGRTASQRKAMLRNLTTNLLWYGRIETTEAKAKEVRAIVDKMITLAIKTYDKTVDVEKEFNNDKQQIVKQTFTNDLPEKLHARRLMMAYLYEIKEDRARNQEKGCAGGYCRIYKLGPRRGDAAERVIIELI